MPSASRRLPLPSKPVRAQLEAKALWNEARSQNAADFFTIGYTGRPTNELLEALGGAGVQTILDVRQNAVSMYRPDLSKANLQRLLRGRGIDYLHLPALGVPRDIRAKAIATGTRQVIWDWYDAHVVPAFVGRNMTRFFNLAEHPVAFLCTERDPSECHRHLLFNALEAKGLRGFDL